jgi:arylsulfatase A-like enzyme
MTRCLSLLLMTLVLSSCRRSDTEAIADEIARVRANCLVIVLDATAAGHVGAYGYTRGTTPTVDAMARDGVLFTRAYSAASSTVVSVPTLVFGAYPQTIAHRAYRDHRGAPGSYRTQFGLAHAMLAWKNGEAEVPPHLVRSFRDSGFRTAGFTENPLASNSLVLGDGFEHFVENKEPPSVRTTEANVAAILEWLGANRTARFFAYLHVLRPHSPYIPPEDIAERFRPTSYRGDLTLDNPTLLAIQRGWRRLRPGDLDFMVSQYDANLFYADQLVARVLQRLADLGIADRTLVVVTADHGEAFGQHGRFFHGSTLYEEMIRIPLVVRFPLGVAVQPARVDVPVTLVDLFPTFVDLFGLTLAKPLVTDGTSLVPLMVNPSTPWPRTTLFAQADTSVAAIGRDFKYLVRLDQQGREEQLFGLGGDPAERFDLAPALVTQVERMRAEVATLLGGPVINQSIEAAVGPLDDERRRQLQSLGYLDEPDEAEP